MTIRTYNYYIHYIYKKYDFDSDTKFEERT